MVVPIRDQAGQQIGAAQERTVGRRRAAEHEVIAAAGSRMPAVGHELLAAQIALGRGLIQILRVIDQLLPARGRMNIHLDHTRIRRHLQDLQACIARRRIAFEHHLHLQFSRRRFNRREQVEIVVEFGERRHEHMQQRAAAAERFGFRLWTGGTFRVARFDADRRTQCFFRRLPALRRRLVARLRGKGQHAAARHAAQQLRR